MPVLPQFSPQGSPTSAIDSFIEGVDKRQSWMDQAARREQLQQQTEQQRQLFELQRPVALAQHKAQLAQFGNDLTAQTQMNDLLTQANSEMPDIRSRWLDTNNINDPAKRLAAQEQVLGTADKYASLRGVGDEIKQWHEVWTQGVVNQRSREALTGKNEIAQLQTQSQQAIAQAKLEAAQQLNEFRAQQAQERQQQSNEMQKLRLELAQNKFEGAGNTTYRQERGKQLASMVNDVQSKVPQYQDTLAQTSRARKLLDEDAQQGRGRATVLGVQQAVNSFIPGLFDISKDEALKTTYAEMALAAASKMRGQGQITENERRLLADTVAQYGNSPQGAKIIMDFMDAVANREIARAELFSNIEGEGRPVTMKDNLDFYAKNPLKFNAGSKPAAAASDAQPAPVKILSIRPLP